jgi:hypothetical protein
LSARQPGCGSANLLLGRRALYDALVWEWPAVAGPRRPRRPGEESTMRILLHVKMPHEPFNAAVRDGTVEQKMKQILEDAKPEAAYFTEYRGQRGAIMIINVNDPSEIPKFAEPWFLLFNADVEFHVAMTPDDLGRAGLDAIGKKWS